MKIVSNYVKKRFSILKSENMTFAVIGRFDTELTYDGIPQLTKLFVKKIEHLLIA
jgi:hypothetical protein